MLFKGKQIGNQKLSVQATLLFARQSDKGANQ